MIRSAVVGSLYRRILVFGAVLSGALCAPSLARTAHATNFQVPTGVRGTLVFSNSNTSDYFWPVPAEFGLIKRNGSGEPTYVALTRNNNNNNGPFYRTPVTGGEVFELYVRRNAAGTFEMPAETFSSDPTKNTALDPIVPEHFSWTSEGTNAWGLAVDQYNYTTDTSDMWQQFTITQVFFDAWIEPTCDNITVACPDPNLVTSNHNTGIPTVGRNWFRSVQNVLSSVGPAIANAVSVDGKDVYTCVNARIDDNTWNFVQESTDFTTVRHARADGGCGPTDGEDFAGPHFLKQLEIKRYHRPKYDSMPVSSFGLGVFSEFDINLTIYPGTSGQETNVVLFDPRSDAPPINFYDISAGDGDNSVDGVFHDRDSHAYRSLIFYNTSGQQEPNPRNANMARLTKHNGESLAFEIINTQAGVANPQSLAGRLTEFRDRNNNLYQIQYSYPANASDATLGYDRTALWIIQDVVDMTGTIAYFYYWQTQTGRRMVNFIQWYDGTNWLFLEYDYSGADPDRLSDIIYPNGDSSFFGYQWDSASQTWELSFNDVAGEGNGQNLLYVYVSNSYYLATDGQFHNQPPGLVRRVLDGNLDRVYQNWEDPRNSNVTYFVEGAGGPGTRLTRLTKSLFGATTEVARSTTAPQWNADPLLQTYAVDQSYAPDTNGLNGSTTNAAGETTTVTRNGDGVITAVTTPDGKTTTTTLDANDRVTKQVDALGVVTAMTYDAADNLLTTVTASGTARAQTWKYTYNAKGLMTSVTNPLNIVTNYAYDTAGRLTSVTDPADVANGTRPVRSFTYDALSRRNAETDAAGRKTTFAYDARGRLVTTTYPDATTETTTYGTAALAGMKVSQKNRNGVTQDWSYDSTRRVVEEIGASNGAASLHIVYEYVPGRYLVSVETADGTRTQNTYDTNDRLTQVTRWATGSKSLASSRTWDGADRVTVETDPYNRRTFYVYDLNGRNVRKVWELVPNGVAAGTNIATLARSTAANPAYTIVDQAYDAVGRMTSQTNERGFVKTTAYDELGRRTQTVEASGTPRARTTTFQYDAANNLTSEVGPRATTAYTYTRRNLVSSRTEASGKTEAATTKKTYTLTGATATTTDARGGVTTFTYATTDDYITSTKDTGGFTTTMTYDAMGHVTSRTDPNSSITRYLYDFRNREVQEQDGLGQATFQDYDDDLTDGAGLETVPMYANRIAALGFDFEATGHAMRKTDPAGGAFLVVTDGLARKVLAVDALGNATTTSYDTVTNGLTEIKVTSPLGKVTTVRQDGAARTREAVDPDGNVTRHTYDAGGNLLSTRDGNGTGVDCVYDELGRRTSCTTTAGDKTSWVYDLDGNVTSTTDPNGNASSCQFDARNRPTSCTNRVGGVSSYTYDANSNLLTEKDTQGDTTTYTYDARNLRLTTTYADASTDKVTNTYDAGRRLATSKDQSGNTLTMAYDAANRLTKINYPSGQADTFGYDAASRITSATAGLYGVNTTRTFDIDGHLVQETTSSPATPTLTVGYAYDSASRLTTLTYPDSSQVTQLYGLGRDLVTEVKRGTFSVGKYTYDAGSRRKTTTFGNGLVETRSFVANDNHVSQVSTPQVGTLIYTYDKNKNKLSETGTAAQGNQTFAYDKDDRLTTFTSPSLNQSWVLSGEADWTSTTRGGVVENRTYNATHELTAVGSTALTYDARGNMTKDNNGNTLVWDVTNRLKEFQKSGGPTVDFLYDAFGRKVGRTVGTSTVAYAYAGDNIIAEYTGTSLTTDYIFGPGGVDDYLAYYNGGLYRWYSSDTIGTVKAVTNDGGMVVERYRFTAYGERTILSSTGTVRTATTVANSIGFTGRPHDVDTGLVDFRSRQYQPRLGRFISRDSKGYIDGHSLYRGYFAPNTADPTGHNIVGDFVSAVSGGASDAWNGIKGGATALYHGAVDAAKALPGVAAGLAGDVGDVLDGAKLLGTELWNATTNLAEEAWDGVSYLAGEVAKGAKYLYGKVKGPIGNWLRTAYDDLEYVQIFAWDFCQAYGQCIWDFAMSAYKLLTGHPEDAFKRFVNFAAGIVNCWSASINLVLVFAAFTGNLTQPLPGPTTLLGIGLGVIGWACTGFADRSAPQIGWYDGGFVFEFPDNPICIGAPARTIGRTIIYAGDIDPDTQAHERQHTVQYGALGGFYLPLQIYAGVISLIIDHNYHDFTSVDGFNNGWHEYNWLEIGPGPPGAPQKEAFEPIPMIPRWN